MNYKIVLVCLLLIALATFASAAVNVLGGNVCDYNAITKTGFQGWPWEVHGDSGKYCLSSYFAGEGIYWNSLGEVVVPVATDTIFSIGGSGMDHVECWNGYGFGWFSIDGCNLGKTTLYGYVTDDVANDSGAYTNLKNEVNTYAPGWLDWNYATNANNIALPYTIIYSFPLPAGDSERCVFTYYSKVIGSQECGNPPCIGNQLPGNINTFTIPICLEGETCTPACGQELTCGEVCGTEDVGVYDDPTCGVYDRCKDYPTGEPARTPPGYYDWKNDCDRTDSCGNMRGDYVHPSTLGNGGTGRFNSCDLTTNAICNVETQLQIGDSAPNGEPLDNDCDGKICRPEVCDGQDNDCDLVGGVYRNYVDNAVYGLASPRLNQPCYTGPAGTENVGLCHGGTQYCSESASPFWGSCVGEVTPVIDFCDGLDNDCNGTKDDSAGLECVKNVLSGQADYRTGDCTSQCKVCQNNKVDSVSLSASEAKNFLDRASSFTVTANASSPNNCLTKYNYELLYSVDGSSWSKAYAGVGVGQSSFSANGSLSRSTTALTDSFNFTMRYLPVGYKYKVRVQVVDAKTGRNVSGSVYANNDWVESNIIIVENTVPTTSDISIPDRDELSQNVFVNLMPSVDPDVFPVGYPGSQSLSYFSRIWDEFSTPTNPAPDCSSSEAKGDFNPVAGMRYSVPLTAQRTYCADARSFDGLVYSDCSVQRCSDETPFNPTCADLGFNATVSSACVNSPQGKTTVYLNVSCSKVQQVIDNKWLVGLSGVKVFDSSNFLQKVIEFTPLSDCTSESKTIAIVYDSNISGVYVADLNYGGTYNTKSLWCSSVKSFEADPVKGCGQESTLSISDATLIVAVIVLAIVIGVLLVKGKKPVQKKKIIKKKRKK